MMNLVIGLCVGIAAAAALVVMWRMAEHLRKEVQTHGNPLAEKKVSHRDEAMKASTGDS